MLRLAVPRLTRTGMPMRDEASSQTEGQETVSQGVGAGSVDPLHLRPSLKHFSTPPTPGGSGTADKRGREPASTRTGHNNNNKNPLLVYEIQSTPGVFGLTRNSLACPGVTWHWVCCPGRLSGLQWNFSGKMVTAGEGSLGQESPSHPYCGKGGGPTGSLVSSE